MQLGTIDWGRVCDSPMPYTSTLPRLVVQGHLFEASFLDSAQTQKSDPNLPRVDRGCDIMHARHGTTDRIPGPETFTTPFL